MLFHDFDFESEQGAESLRIDCPYDFATVQVDLKYCTHGLELQISFLDFWGI